MLTHPTLDQLNAMGFYGMAKAFSEITANTEADSLGHAEWLALLLDREVVHRQDKRLIARLRYARLRHQAAPEDIDYRVPRDNQDERGATIRMREPIRGLEA